MYRFIDPEMVNSRIEEWGGQEMLLEIISMLDNDFNLKTKSLLPAAVNLDFTTVEEIVHPLKSNLLLFVNESSEYGKLIKDLLAKSRNHESFRIKEDCEVFVTSGLKTLEELAEFTSEF